MFVTCARAPIDGTEIVNGPWTYKVQLSSFRPSCRVSVPFVQRQVLRTRCRCGRELSPLSPLVVGLSVCIDCKSCDLVRSPLRLGAPLLIVRNHLEIIILMGRLCGFGDTYNCMMSLRSLAFSVASRPISPNVATGVSTTDQHEELERQDQTGPPSLPSLLSQLPFDLESSPDWALCYRSIFDQVLSAFWRAVLTDRMLSVPDLSSGEKCFGQIFVLGTIHPLPWPL
ncbi:hypothetical protein DFS33DRAFT_872203 [Desarmillaria ectypa]|nr:hypothetical protein DFS33DRAFT_872203 [Desarmillaria ectypa]